MGDTQADDSSCERQLLRAAAAESAATAARSHTSVDDDDDEHLFATLTPLGRPACEAFAAVARKMHDEPTWALNARRFIHVDNEQHWTGHYFFDLRVSPRELTAGWVWGSNPSAVDILLVPHLHEAQVGGTHCQVSIQRHVNTLLIRAGLGKEVIVRGADVVTAASPYVLTAHSGVAVGALHYVFDFHPRLATEPQRFIAQLRQHRHERGWQEPEVPMALSPTPTVHARKLQGFCIEQPAARGAFGAVAFGYRLRGGQAVAAKRLAVTADNRHNVKHEINLLTTFRHPAFRHVCYPFLSTTTTVLRLTSVASRTMSYA